MESSLSELQILERLSIALALGLLIGTERGWAEREAEKGTRVAGIRSFGLVSFLGALWTLANQNMEPWGIAIALFCLALLFSTAYGSKANTSHEYGITTAVALLITFALGVLSMQGHLIIAASSAVVTTLLLDLKPTLHVWLSKLKPEELHAALKLLLIALVLLPILPNRGLGTGQVLNPYEIGWMVLLIAALSFVGYFAMKLLGPRQGVMLTALAGGLASSTAVTLNFARLSRKEVTLQRVLAAGILVASGTMFPRILAVATLIQPNLLAHLALPMLAMMISSYSMALWYWRTAKSKIELQAPVLKNPFDINVALQFGALLTLILLITHSLRNWLGHTGLYVLAAFSGLSDVDAITLSLARMTAHDLEPTVAATGILIASVANTIVKMALTISIGQGAIRYRVGGGLALVLAVGLLCHLLFISFR